MSEHFRSVVTITTVFATYIYESVYESVVYLKVLKANETDFDIGTVNGTKRGLNL